VSYSELILDVEGPVGWIRLNRPKSLNALSPTLFAELSEALGQIDADPEIRCTVLTGEGRAFSAGIDIKASPSGGGQHVDVEWWRATLKAEIAVLFQIWESPKPVIAAVNGYCLGFACDLAMVCDATVASAAAEFGEPEIRQVSASTFLIMPFVLGMKKTKELLLTGRRIDAATAERAGMVTSVVAPEDLESAARALARELAAIPPVAMRLNKRAINQAYELMGLRDAVNYNIEVFCQIMVSEAASSFGEAVQAKGFKQALADRDAAFSA
jgi:enoyl-CoA hydratase